MGRDDAEGVREGPGARRQVGRPRICRAGVLGDGLAIGGRVVLADDCGRRT